MIDPRLVKRSMTRRRYCGFLVAATTISGSRIPRRGIQDADIDGKVQRRGIGDKLSSAQSSTLVSKTFYGNDVDPQMVGSRP